MAPPVKDGVKSSRLGGSHIRSGKFVENKGSPPHRESIQDPPDVEPLTWFLCGMHYSFCLYCKINFIQALCGDFTSPAFIAMPRSPTDHTQSFVIELK